jgi:hypothetical protein
MSNNIFTTEYGLPRVDHTHKLGVYLATHGSATFLKLSLLQIRQQTRWPDYVSIFENGNAVSLKPLVEDVLAEMQENGIRVRYEHRPLQMKHPFFHLTALSNLLEMSPDISLITKFDQDDIFYANHLESLEQNIGVYDAAVNAFGEAAYCVANEAVAIRPLMSFERINPTGGMSDCVIMKRNVASQYLQDMIDATFGLEDDFILGKITLPKFNVNRYKATPTACYVTHDTNTSLAWWRGTGKDKKNANFGIPL